MRAKVLGSSDNLDVCRAAVHDCLHFRHSHGDTA